MAPGVLPTALSLAFASAAAIAPTREQTPARGPNLAFHRPASQSSRSQWSRPADPQGGVDGVKTGAYGFHTEYEPKPWWAVDLQQVAELDELRIYNSRKAPEAARTIQVWLSSDGVDWTRAYAHDGSLFGGADGPLRVWLNGRRARHVRVQLAHTDYLHLNEIEVYGRPVAESSGIASPVVSAGRSQAPATRAGGFGPETETARTRVTGESGGYVRLANGARFEVPRGVVTGEAEVRVHRAIPGGAATRAGLLSDVHYLDSDVRPKLAGHLTLRVPLGPGQAPEDAAAYAVSESGLVYGIPGRVDAATLTMVIEDPEIAVIPQDAARLPAVRADRVPRVGYAVGPAAGLSPHPTCLSGAPGEIHDQPGHSFRIVFHVQAPCALARQVSDVLQQALEVYDADFQDANGQRPFARLSPESRIWVYLLADGPISRYEHSLRWNGTMRVNVALARADPARLREALFRELFHAVQDAHSSVSLAGSAPWWYEATAEWAAIRYSRAVPPGAERGVDFPSAVRTELARHDYLLSVPIDESGGYEGGTLAYGYALLVDHVERQAPGYVRQSLLAGGGTSGRLYQELVAAGRLRDTYPEFLASVLAEAAPAGPWLQASLEESEHETRIVTHPAGKLGEPRAITRAVRDDLARAAPHVFGAVLRPLTARFFRVKAADEGLSRSRTVRIALLSEQPDFVPRVLVATTSRGQDRPVTLRPTTGQTLDGLGSGLRELWLAVYNPDPTSAAEFRLAITIEKAPAPAVASYALADTRPSPDRAQGVSWSYGDEDAIEDVTYPDGRREIRRFALTARPPQTIVPGVPFTIAVTAAARDEGGVGSAQHDVRPVFCRRR